MTPSPTFEGKRIILGVTGGIAAYKSAVLLRELQKSGAEVRCIMTPSALRFLGKDTLSALTRQPVPVDVFPDDADINKSWSRHIQWAEWADLMLIAPCTANTLAKITHGLSDNMLTSTVLAARCPVVLSPTMDGGMYESPAMRMNRELAKELGYHLIEPEHGYLASGLEDKGRLPENQAILNYIAEVLNPTSTFDQLLAGKKVVVTAGPTREYLDPVRFLSNPSSGRMGIAMAVAARNMGAEVTLIHGKLADPVPDGIEFVEIISADDLFEAVKSLHADTDIFIMAAAVSDFKPETRADSKVKKNGAAMQIPLLPTPDSLKWLGENRIEGQTLIGFAMETENLIEAAAGKLERKKADFIIANTIGQSGSGFESETNDVFLIGNSTEPTAFSGAKTEIAVQVLQTIFRDKRG